jgi:hypothetical protein
VGSFAIRGGLVEGPPFFLVGRSDAHQMQQSFLVPLRFAIWLSFTDVVNSVYANDPVVGAMLPHKKDSDGRSDEGPS